MKLRYRVIAATFLALFATLSAGDVHAGSNGWTVAMTMIAIESDGDSYTIHPDQLPNNSTNDPANCQTSGSDITTIKLNTSGVSAGAPRELLAKTILAGYLAGRDMRLFVHGTACNGSSPTYYAVKME